MTVARNMPPRFNLGRPVSSTMGAPMSRLNAWREDPVTENPAELRTVMGYPLPVWQRMLVWSEAQQIKLLESAWLGLSIGTYTFNQVDYRHPLDGLLVDGQQRMFALERYLDDAFPVFGFRWSEVTEADRRAFAYATHFNSYIISTTDEDVLKGYYNLMNFGGVAHSEDQRA